MLFFCLLRAILSRPLFAALDSVAFIFRGRVKSKFMQLLAGKLLTESAVRLPPLFAAGFDVALGPPKRFFYCKAARALHNLTPFTVRARQAASGFNHGWLLLVASSIAAFADSIIITKNTPTVKSAADKAARLPANRYCTASRTAG